MLNTCLLLSNKKFYLSLSKVLIFISIFQTIWVIWRYRIILIIFAKYPSFVYSLIIEHTVSNSSTVQIQIISSRYKCLQHFRLLVINPIQPLAIFIEKLAIKTQGIQLAKPSSGIKQIFGLNFNFFNKQSVIFVSLAFKPIFV